MIIVFSLKVQVDNKNNQKTEVKHFLLNFQSNGMFSVGTCYAMQLISDKLNMDQGSENTVPILGIPWKSSAFDASTAVARIQYLVV